MKEFSDLNVSLLNPTPGNFNRFLRLPFKMVTETFVEEGEALSPTHAFLMMIAYVNYEDNLEYHLGPCLRGESYKSLQQWSDLFGWSKSRTRRFFARLSSGGIIKTENRVKTTWLKVMHYDYYVGKKNICSNDVYSDDFEEFWTKYHRIMMIPSTNKYSGFMIWKKLSTEERKKATAMIERFYYNQDKDRYCVKAANYLRNKNFNDQFLC